MEVDTIDRIAGGFYEAALDPGRLQPALEALARFGGAKGANFLHADVNGVSGTVVADVGHAPETRQAYNTHYRDLDPLAPLSLRMPVGGWLNDWRAFGHTGYAHGEYYNEFIRRFDNHAVLACILTRENGGMSLFSLQRSRAQGAFTGSDEERLHPLVAHLQRASRLYTVTAQLRERAHVASAALEHTGAAVWVLERNGHVVHANCAAERLAADPRLFRTTFGALEPVHEPRRWQEALERATLPAAARATWLSLRGAGPQAQAVVVAPLTASAPLGQPFQRPLAVVLAPEVGHDDAAHLACALHALYGLTPAEARVARLLGDGLTPHEIAGTLAVSESTVRTQLKAVYAKLRIRRQAELARLVAMLRMPATHDAR